MNRAAWKLLDILEETATYFAGKGIENPRLQAEILLADVLELRRLDLYLQFERLLRPEEVDAYRGHVRRRAANVPAQYITGVAAFRGLELAVNDQVLIPRPETEILVDVALEHLDGPRDNLAADIGTGSGAVALSLAQEHPSCQVLATDVSRPALNVARANTAGSGLEAKVWCVAADMAVGLVPARPGDGFDCIVSNPPYIPSAAIAELEPEVRANEPRLALDGGDDGLDCYHSIAARAGDLLKPGGLLAVEVGDPQQANDVAALFSAVVGLTESRIRDDLNSIPRVVLSTRSGG